MTVGNRIKQRRIELGWTQTELAERMGYSGKSSVCAAETSGDNITTTKVRKFAEALGVSFRYLMGWEEEQDIPTAHKEMLEEYVNRERLSQYSQEQITRALNFLDAFTKAAPEVQIAIETLLKGRQSDS